MAEQKYIFIPSSMLKSIKYAKMACCEEIQKTLQMLSHIEKKLDYIP